MNELDSAKLFLEAIPMAMRAIKMQMRKVAGAEFTVPQYRLLLRLSRESGSNQELAEWMGVKPPTMSRMVDSLVERGLVSRKSKSFDRRLLKSNRGDRRSIEIQVTHRGRAKAQKVRGLVAEHFVSNISRMSEDEKQSLIQGLSLLKRHFGESKGAESLGGAGNSDANEESRP